jgi:hypothetical protein
MQRAYSHYNRKLRFLSRTKRQDNVDVVAVATSVKCC